MCNPLITITEIQPMTYTVRQDEVVARYDELLHSVLDGNEVIITDGAKPIARLEPISNDDSSVIGIWKDRFAPEQESADIQREWRAKWQATS